MKKLISLILAVLILCTFSVNAFADQNANCITISNITLQSLKDDNEFTLSLDGLEVAIVPVVNEAKNTFSVNVLGNDELLLNAALMFDGNTAYIAIDGLNNIYCLDINSLLPSYSSSFTPASWKQIVTMMTQMIDDGAFNEDGALSDFNAEQMLAEKTIHIKFDPADSYTLFELKDGSDQFSFGADVRSDNRAVECYAIGDVSSALDADNLTEEELVTLKAELTTVLAKPIRFLVPSLLAAGIIK